MATEYCLVCAAHGRKVAAVRIDYPQGDRVDYKCPVCPYATTLVSRAAVKTVLFMFKQTVDNSIDEMDLQQEIEKKVTNEKKQEDLECELQKLLLDDPMTVPSTRISKFTELHLRWLLRNLGIGNNDHKNYPKAIELIKELLRFQQQKEKNVNAT